MTTLKIATAIAVLISITSTADAAKRHKNHKPPIILKIDQMQVYAFDANGNKSSALVTTFSAKRHSHRSGNCDGFSRCRCGVTQANHFGLPLSYNGYNLKQASEWPRAFRHTSLHVGAVMYRHGGGPTGHVSRVVSIEGGCNITVADEAGQHPDSACGRGNVFVDVNGNQTFAQAALPQKRNRHQHTVYAAVNDTIVDRFSVH